MLTITVASIVLGTEYDNFTKFRPTPVAKSWLSTGLKTTKWGGSGAIRKVAKMLKFSRKEEGEQEKEMEGKEKGRKERRRERIQDRMGGKYGKKEELYKKK